MKKIILMMTLLATLNAIDAHAGPVIVSEKFVNLTTDISVATVKFSHAGYSAPVVKILVPELANVTLLDHRNAGEGAPCLASYEAISPMQVIQNNPVIEKNIFKITLSRSATLDPATGACQVTLFEDIVGKIRGLTFTHSRTADLGTRDPKDCQ
jgi:hypothetical protein